MTRAGKKKKKKQGVHRKVQRNPNGSLVGGVVGWLVGRLRWLLSAGWRVDRLVFLSKKLLDRCKSLEVRRQVWWGWGLWWLWIWWLPCQRRQQQQQPKQHKHKHKH